jgi:hypothetical protein
MTDDHRDPVVARALRELPVPDHAPGFWARLDARLDAEDRPGAQVESPADVRVATSELPAVTLLRPEEHRVNPRHRQRFLAAAAVIAVVAVVTGLALRGDDDPGSQFAATTAPPATPSTPTPTATTATTGPPVQTLPPMADAQAAVERWIGALASGDEAEAAALLGPGTRRYLESQDLDVTDFMEGYGAWATSEDLAVTTVLVPWTGAVVVLSGTREAEGSTEVRTEAIPLVPATTPADSTWFVEPLAADPLTGGRPETVTPAPDVGIGNWVGQRPDVVFEARSSAEVEYWFSLDGEEAVPDEDGVYDPPGDLATGTHLLVVAVVGDGVFGATAGTFVVE